MSQNRPYDIIVIGAGHAGIETALAAARMGCRTAMVTLSDKTIGAMSCNPAIGGVAKGQLVREIDALGGEMAKAADGCAIQFRMLNASKGPAVQSPRAQIDRARYVAYMTKAVKKQKNLTLVIAEVTAVTVKDGVVAGVTLKDGRQLAAKAVVIAPGTFLAGLIHVGLEHQAGGRITEQAANALADNLRNLGLRLMRFKTGTCARLDRKSIDYSNLAPQQGDQAPQPFSFSTKKIRCRQVPCYITYTTEATHAIIKDNLDKSPLYAGIIKATGVRYCPSIEDKVVRFPDRARHQIFLEPEGRSTRWVYPNGVSTSLPEKVQLEMLRSIPGLEKVKIFCYGYGIEHTVVDPIQLYPTLETKPIRNLYLAGQINGTTGYEEAAAQGLIAGINAALRVQGKEPLVLDRSTSYIGVLIDDLTTKGTLEPYRMFTSRVEHRLLVRNDNADVRLRKFGFSVGLVTKKQYEQIEKKISAVKKGMEALRRARLKPGAALNRQLKKLGITPINRPASAEDLLKRPGVSMEQLKKIPGLKIDLAVPIAKQVEIEVKYSGFIKRQLAEVERFKHLEKIRLPESLDYASIPALSREIREKLAGQKPLNLGQASRISGVTPVAISILMVYLKKLNG
ncbi:MAG: tRNA uridine-5-carboxymethylaminomethyl(34) synthesis enzyme MnmG [Candidatus Omnitrophica bacterium]|nr:tRNA uridine-5-carboxymethylaminomethyl(34) synthesis enzyme MnmG [Candidatus Omnitrophota bacterium]